MISQKSFVQTNVAYITMVRFITMDSVTRIKFNVIRHNTVIREGKECLKRRNLLEGLRSYDRCCNGKVTSKLSFAEGCVLQLFQVGKVSIHLTGTNDLLLQARVVIRTSKCPNFISSFGRYIEEL